MIRLVDLQPSNLAWLREHGYINGLGPRSWVIDGKRVVLPGWIHLPTPGLEPVWEQHDLDCLLGGSLANYGDARIRVLDGMEDEAQHSWFGRAWLIRRGEPVVKWALDTYGKQHFRFTSSGVPRTEDQLMREMRP